MTESAGEKTQYELVCHTAGAAECWAVHIEAGKLRDDDVGAYISVDHSPWAIAAGHARWQRLESVSHAPGDTILWIDGVVRTLDSAEYVFLGETLGGPDHLLRGAFVR